LVTDPVNPPPQQADYIHCSFNADNLSNITNIRVEFDVNNGAADFAQNFLYFDIRTNDLLAAVTGASSQLGAVQVALQRQNIDTNIGDATALPTLHGINGPTPGIGSLGPGGIPDFGSSSDQTTLGNTQWSEIMFPVLALTRVGNDQTRTLANCQRMRIAVTVTANVVFKFASVWFGSGGQADVGDIGTLYFYRAQPRSSITGARGNPSPSTRYGVSPRRQKVVLTPPSSAYDAQIDTWDYYRVGGQLIEWRYIGSAPTGQSYVDNVGDIAIAGNETLTFDCLEPWPSIGPGIQATSATVVGTTMVAVFPTATAFPSGFGTLSQIGNLLPGNIFSIGPNAFTLFNRPILKSSSPTTQTWLLQFVENAGNLTNPFVQCQEPALAAQTTNNVWGPDANGRIFSVGAGGNQNNGVALRPGVVQWSDANDPDCSADTNTADLCPPTEPLQNGGLAGGIPIVFSSSRAWAGYIKADGSGYNWQEIPVGRGMAADLAVCSDGRSVYYVAKDSIRRTAGGGSESLTDADLYNLFPHEGLFPQNVTYAGQTVFAPEYKYASNFRLAAVNNFLYFDYLDSTQIQRTLVCDLRKAAWSVDVGVTPFTIHAGTTAPGSNNQAPGTAVRNQQLFVGDTSGAISVEQSNPVAGTGEIVACALATKEEILGDLRALKVFGDFSVDALLAGGAVQATPVFLGVPFGAVTTLAGGQVARTDPPAAINLNGGQMARSAGLLLQWSDQGQTTVLYDWQPSYIPQPENTANRFTDWDNAGTENAKFMQGFELECDTSGIQKAFVVRDADTLQVHPFSSALGPNVVNHNGQQIKAYSFVSPFVAHLVRIEPVDNVSWRFFGVKWEGQPTPESVLNWQTQGSSLGLKGYMHIQHLMAAYASVAPVTLTITAFDGVSPAPIILPSTGGAYQKLSFILSPNKGLLYTFKASSLQPWTPFLNDWEINCREWGDSGPYKTYRNIGGTHGIMAAI